ncbi:MAG: hypothetical protein J4F49_11765 [Rhodobacteraceae bacterium]|nr:hypothetical protein [Paracoccaceae bacterium]
MELLRFTKDMFGQKMLVGINWELLWLPVAAALAVIALHLFVRALRKGN